MCLFFCLPQRAIDESLKGEPQNEDASTPVTCSKSEPSAVPDPKLPAYTEQDRIRAHALGLRL